MGDVMDDEEWMRVTEWGARYLSDQIRAEGVDEFAARMERQIEEQGGIERLLTKYEGIAVNGMTAEETAAALREKCGLGPLIEGTVVEHGLPEDEYVASDVTWDRYRRLLAGMHPDTEREYREDYGAAFELRLGTILHEATERVMSALHEDVIPTRNENGTSVFTFTGRGFNSDYVIYDECHPRQNGKTARAAAHAEGWHPEYGHYIDGEVIEEDEDGAPTAYKAARDQWSREYRIRYYGHSVLTEMRAEDFRILGSSGA